MGREYWEMKMAVAVYNQFECDSVQDVLFEAGGIWASEMGKKFIRRHRHLFTSAMHIIFDYPDKTLRYSPVTDPPYPEYILNYPEFMRIARVILLQYPNIPVPDQINRIIECLEYERKEKMERIGKKKIAVEFPDKLHSELTNGIHRVWKKKEVK